MPKKTVVGIIIFVCVCIGLALLHPWTRLSPTFFSRLPFSVPRVTPHLLDDTYGQTIQAEPGRDAVVQVIDAANVIITVTIPKGTISHGQTIRVSPLYHDVASPLFSQGVFISPSSIVFNKPISLSFDFSKSKITTRDAPAKPNPSSPRTTGIGQVLHYNSATNMLTPTLIARAAETSTYLPARILTGGAYIYDTQGLYREYFASSALMHSDGNVLSIVESEMVLLTSRDARWNNFTAQTHNAIDKILTKKNPPAEEFFAAIVLRDRLDKKTAGFIPVVHAADIAKGYLEFMCKLPGLSLSQYLTEATTAKYLGYDDVFDGCMTAARNIVASQARKVLNNPNATMPDVIQALKAVQLLGDMDELDTALQEKAVEVANRDAQKVLDNPNAYDWEILRALQEVQLVGGSNNLENQLIQRFETAHHGNPPPRHTPSSPPTGGEVGKGFDDAVIWLTIAKILGIGPDSFDQAGIQAWVDKWVNWSTQMQSVIIPACYEVRALAQEMGVDASQLQCEYWDSQLSDLISQLKSKGAEAASQVGAVQSGGYQKENYGTGGWKPQPTP